MQTQEEVEKLLMMFIKDGYSFSGKISKKTAIAMMKFVEKDSDLQRYVINGDNKSLLNHKIKVQS